VTTRRTQRKGYVAMKAYTPDPPDPLPVPRTPPGGEGKGWWEVASRQSLSDGSMVVTWAWRWAQAVEEPRR
jgi:hypothetical protein